MKTTIVLLFICFSYQSFGQNVNENRKSIFVEFAGTAGLGSINYEKSFYNTELLELNWRLGFSVGPIDRNNGAVLVFPVMVNSLIGTTAHKLELGLGQGLSVTTKGSPFALAVATVGYRYAPSSKKWFYRITYTPLISYLVDFQVQQWGGISIGYNLNRATYE